MSNSFSLQQLRNINSYREHRRKATRSKNNENSLECSSARKDIEEIESNIKNSLLKRKTSLSTFQDNSNSDYFSRRSEDVGSARNYLSTTSLVSEDVLASNRHKFISKYAPQGSKNIIQVNQDEATKSAQVNLQPQILILRKSIRLQNTNQKSLFGQSRDPNGQGSRNLNKSITQFTLHKPTKSVTTNSKVNQNINKTVVASSLNFAKKSLAENTNFNNKPQNNYSVNMALQSSNKLEVMKLLRKMEGLFEQVSKVPLARKNEFNRLAAEMKQLLKEQMI